MQSISDFPNRGGANGSIRFFPEIGHGANAGELSQRCRYRQIGLIAGRHHVFPNSITVKLGVDFQGWWKLAVAICRTCGCATASERNLR